MRLHRKLPRTESLKDCMDRTIPYWANTIVPDAIAAGKNVLVASSENAIRGLRMHDVVNMLHLGQQQRRGVLRHKWWLLRQ